MDRFPGRIDETQGRHFTFPMCCRHARRVVCGRPSQKTEIAMPAILSSSYALPILMLLGSNIFMTLAWYGHLRFKEVPLAGVIFAAWGIALVEYCLAVPANRWGNAVYSTAQLKTIQEIITLMVFAGFSVFYLKEPLGWNHAVGFALIALGAFFVFQKW
jgi:uncharacterized protein (DUF486 family)